MLTHCDQVHRVATLIHGLQNKESLFNKWAFLLASGEPLPVSCPDWVRDSEKYRRLLQEVSISDHVMVFTEVRLIVSCVDHENDCQSIYTIDDFGNIARSSKI